jgi:Predicted transcriptional regulators
MITRIREVRRARGMTLEDGARACEPATTPQTIGRLETGTRTVSVGWLNRIAKALGVEARDLVHGGEPTQLGVAAVLGPTGATGAQAHGNRRLTAHRRRPAGDHRLSRHRRLSLRGRDLVRYASTRAICPGA